MNLEIEIFKKCIKDQDCFFMNMEYIETYDAIYNQSDLENVFYQKKYSNDILQKEITFTYYPSTRKITKNEIGIYLTFNSTSIDIPTFLAFNKFNRKLKYDDVKKYRFTLDSENIENSIKIRLKEIQDILSISMFEFVSKEKWMEIPIYDIRDDY